MRPLADRELVIHDAKPVLEWWLEYETTQPALVQDSAVAAYLLNAGRATYKLDEVCMEAFAECPPRWPAASPASTAAAVPPPPQCRGVRARGGRARSAPHADGACALAHALLAHAAAELDDKALRAI